jgi:hypothetical protein
MSSKECSLKVLALLAIGPLLVLTGCGKPTGSIQGSVSYEGKPIVGAGVLFLPAQGDYREARGDKTQADGRYQVPSLTVGPKEVQVNGGTVAGADGKPAGLPFGLQVSPETVEIHPGNQRLDITLTMPR